MDVLGKLFEVVARHATKRASGGNVHQFFCHNCLVGKSNIQTMHATVAVPFCVLVASIRQ